MKLVHYLFFIPFLTISLIGAEKADNADASDTIDEQEVLQLNRAAEQREKDPELQATNWILMRQLSDALQKLETLSIENGTLRFNAKQQHARDKAEIEALREVLFESETVKRHLHKHKEAAQHYIGQLQQHIAQLQQQQMIPQQPPHPRVPPLIVPHPQYATVNNGSPAWQHPSPIERQ